jgi:hypothetical protein
MKKALTVFGVLLFLAGAALAKPGAKTSSQQNVPAFPGTLINARYVYVTGYDGNEFSSSLLPEDRQAIGAVQEAMQKWGKFILVYRQEDADIVLMVQSRPTEDVLAVYDAHGWPGSTYLWRMMGPSGLQSGETPFVTLMERAFDKTASSK